MITSADFLAHLIAAAVLLVLYLLVSGLLGRWWDVVDLFVGADKRPSASKFQLFVWTVVVLYSYAAIYAARALRGYFEAIDQVPPNLLTAMGLSVFTATAAKGITVGYVQTGRSARSDPPETRAAPIPLNALGAPAGPARNVLGGTLQKRGGIASLVTDENGFPDLSKIQMICWTFIAVVIYLVGLCGVVHDIPKALSDDLRPTTHGRFTHQVRITNADIIERVSLPDISAALMVLMGLGQGAYLGKKLVTFDVARLTQLNPAAGRPGTMVTISGVSLSEAPDGNQVTLNRRPLDGASKAVNSQISFTWPLTQPDGLPWRPGEVVQVGVITGGQESANSLPFTVTAGP